MKTTAYVGTSLDGFIARTNGDIDWLATFENEEVNDSFRDFIGTVDAVVMGRGTFEKALTYPSWPYEHLRVFVLSASMKDVPDRLKGGAIVLSMKPGELLRYLASEGFSSISVDGGKVIQGFLREDLIDEVIVTRVPLLIGGGIPLFGSLDNDLRFRHRQTAVFSNGLVRSHYERDRT